MSLDVKILKQCAYSAIDNVASKLHQLSDIIWSNPEICFQENKAHDNLCTFLEEHGFSVDRHFELDTAFRAQLIGKRNGPNIAVLCEYDALPGLGHACGHNLIAEAGVAAAIGIQAAFNSAKGNLGKLTIYGTPAEESGGGKVLLLEAGAFDDVDVALMVHPLHINASTIDYLASASVKVRYEGKAAHAAAAPWNGVNALDAAVLAYQNISCLRQQMKPTWRIHGVITDGGTQCNIIPETSDIEFQVRAPTLKDMLVLRDKVKKCFEAAATATGCKLTYRDAKKKYYANVIYNKALLRTFLANGESLGVTYKTSDMTASTDMGNVSHKVPAIHPLFDIGTSALVHTKDFTSAAGAPTAQPPTIIQGKIIAATAIDIFTNDYLLQEIKECFREDMLNQ